MPESQDTNLYEPTEAFLGMSFPAWSARVRLRRSQSSFRSFAKAKSIRFNKNAERPPYVSSPLTKTHCSQRNTEAIS